MFGSGRRPVPHWGAYSAPQTPSWSARQLRGLRHSHIQNLTRISDHSLAALRLPCRHLAINLPYSDGTIVRAAQFIDYADLSVAQRKHRVAGEMRHYFFFP